jgi:hypothetical protein
MARKELKLDFYTKAILVGIVIPYAFIYTLMLPSQNFGKLIALLAILFTEYILFKITIKEYRSAMGIRPKFKPYSKQKKKKDKPTTTK